MDDVAAARLAELDLLRRRVINVVGHELRTPITTVRGLAEALASAEPGDEAAWASVVPAMLRSARRAERLLDEMLMATGVETALPVGIPRAIDVHEVLGAAWSSIEPGGDLTVDGDATVVVAPGALEAIVTPVLDNAAKYGHGAGVRITTTADDVAIEVRSPSGSSLPESELPLAFEPFFRGEAAVMATPGLGLGLAIARAVAAHSGGNIDLRRDGDDVVATIHLPAQP